MSAPFFTVSFVSFEILYKYLLIVFPTTKLLMWTILTLFSTTFDQQKLESLYHTYNLCNTCSIQQSRYGHTRIWKKRCQKLHNLKWCTTKFQIEKLFKLNMQETALPYCPCTHRIFLEYPVFFSFSNNSTRYENTVSPNSSSTWQYFPVKTTSTLWTY